GNCTHTHAGFHQLFHITKVPPSMRTQNESSLAVGPSMRANSRYVPLLPTVNGKSMNPAALVGALAVLFCPAWMVTYCELDAVESVGLVHKEPAEAHSASFQTEVWAAAATVNRENTSAGITMRRKPATRVFMGPPSNPLTRAESNELPVSLQSVKRRSGRAPGHPRRRDPSTAS